MAKYNVTYKCGHEDRVELFGKMSARDWRLEQMAGELCPECQKKESERATAEFEEENGLPLLSGSEKQVAWARKLRYDFLSGAQELSKNYEKAKFREEIYTRNEELQKRMREVQKEKAEEFPEFLNKTILYVSEQTTSTFFIDNRTTLNIKETYNFKLDKMWYVDCYYNMVEKYAKEYDNFHDIYEVEARKEQEEEEQTKIEAEKSAQVTMQPEQKGSNTIVTLKIQDDTVKLCSEYDSGLVDCIHGFSLRMTWNKPCWEFKAEAFRGTAESVLMEIGNKLLENGYTVVFPCKELADMSLSGEFEKYRTNAIYAHKSNENKLIVEYDKNDGGVCRELGFIKGGIFRRTKNLCYIPIGAYESLEELAETNNFAWEKTARERVDGYKHSLIIANPVHVERDEVAKAGRKEFDLSDLNDD